MSKFLNSKKSAKEYLLEESGEKLKEDISSQEMKEFVNYFLEFYGDKGSNKIKGLKNNIKLIEDATRLFIKYSNTPWGGGDSLDRESVRDIVKAVLQPPHI